MIRERRALGPVTCAHFLSNKRQNQQNSARERPALSIPWMFMAAGSMQRPERLTLNNDPLLRVDHQAGLYPAVRDIDVLQLKYNIVGADKSGHRLNTVMHQGEQNETYAK
jgi:hypothetical protein